MSVGLVNDFPKLKSSVPVEGFMLNAVVRSALANAIVCPRPPGLGDGGIYSQSLIIQRVSRGGGGVSVTLVLWPTRCK